MVLEHFVYTHFELIGYLAELCFINRDSILIKLYPPPYLSLSLSIIFCHFISVYVYIYTYIYG